MSPDAVAVAAGACLGALSRWQIGQLATEYFIVRTKGAAAAAEASTSTSTAKQRAAALQGWHTAAINVGGSFLLGGIAGTPLVGSVAASAAASSSRLPPPQASATFPHRLLPSFAGAVTPRTKLLAGVGFCGSFTTFSTYSVDVVQWLGNGQVTKAAAYVAANNVGGVAAAAAGLFLARKLFGGVP